MPKRFDIGISRVFPNADSLEIKLLQILYYLTIFLIVCCTAIIVSDLSSYSTVSYYPHSVSFLALFILVVYFLRTGKKSSAINSFNLLPLPAYFLFISPQLAIFPPERSFFMEIGLFLAGLMIYLIYAEKPRQLIPFLFFTTATLIYHISTTSFSDYIFNMIWPEEHFSVNPILFYLLIGLSSLLMFYLHHHRLKEQTEKLHTVRENFSRVAYHFPEGIIHLHINRDEFGERTGMSVGQVNPAFEEIFEVRNSEVKNGEAHMLFQKIFRDEVNWQDLFLSGKQHQTEIQLQHLDKWFRVLSIPVDQDTIIGYFEDLTAAKNTLTDLQNSRHRYKLLLETIPDIFFVIDKDGTYVDYVAKVGEGIDLDESEIIGSTIFEVGFSQRMVRQVFQSIQTVINHDAIETIEYALEVKGKGSCFFEMRMVKVNDSSVMAISRDITKQKLAQQAIEEARKKAEEADLLKSAFLQNMSHEVRTPLNAILGFSNVLLNDEVSRHERISFLQLIVRNGQLLLHVFNDTIKLSRIQSGLMSVNKQLFNINGLIIDLNRQFSYEKEQLGKKHILLHVRKGNDNPKFSIYTDGQKIKDIMESLLDNAIKFTKEGEVEFGYSLIGGSNIEFFVKDTGIGIPTDKFDVVFDRFHQLDSSMTREYGGTGIGLSLARDFAGMLGTKIRIESTLGRGSRFSFVLPIEAGTGHLRIV